ncbi:MAG: hypothetical protein A2W31_13865 [Planctomycetes bacterium RBG_16_64_10]|nr:MAG: hypothetical protein A2W31_13865 [Planctomycetes bacterium RBG_16_64_10]
MARDGYGAERFRISLAPARATQTTYLGNPESCYAVVRDHLLFLSTGHQIVAVDTLGGVAHDHSNVLWQRDLAEQIPGVQQPIITRLRRRLFPGRPPRYRAEDAQGRPVSVLGPASAHGMTFQHDDSLVCVELVTGEPVWVRRAVPPGCELFGDDEVLLAVPPSGTEETVDALVIAPLTGDLLGRRTVPRLGATRQRVATVGRQTLDWLDDGAHLQLVMADVWASKVVWSRQFARAAQIWLLDSEALGVLDPAGQFVLLSLTDGQAQIEAQLEPEPELAAIYLLGSKDQILLITSSPVAARTDRAVSPVPGLGSQLLVSGRVYAFDRRTGALQWPMPARIQQQGLWLSQPSELPVLTFAQLTARREGSSRGRTDLSVLCLDRRSGRCVYQASDLPRAGTAPELLGEPDQGRVTFLSATHQVTMTFSDEPVAAEPPFQGESDGGHVGRLLRILGVIPRAIAKAADELEDQDPFGELPPDNDLDPVLEPQREEDDQ